MEPYKISLGQMFVQNSLKNSIRLGPVKLSNIYHWRKNTTKFYWMKSNQSFENMFVYPVYYCIDYTNIVSNIIQVSSFYNN